MEISELKVRPEDMTKNMTIKIDITGMRLFKIKLSIAAFLFVIGARLIGVNLEWVDGKTLKGAEKCHNS